MSDVRRKIKKVRFTIRKISFQNLFLTQNTLAGAVEVRERRNRVPIRGGETVQCVCAIKELESLWRQFGGERRLRSNVAPGSAFTNKCALQAACNSQKNKRYLLILTTSSGWVANKLPLLGRLNYRGQRLKWLASCLAEKQVREVSNTRLTITKLPQRALNRRQWRARAGWETWQAS